MQQRDHSDHRPHFTLDEFYSKQLVKGCGECCLTLIQEGSRYDRRGQCDSGRR